MIKFDTNEQKVRYAIDSIQSGQDIQRVAKSLGYKNVKSLDMLMRREGYYKDRQLGNYVPKNAARDDGVRTTASLSGKAWEVMALYKEQPNNPKQIAQKAGFENMREMASYMKSKGYGWDADRENFVAEAEPGIPNPAAPEPHQSEEPEQESTVSLKYLLSRKDKLVELLESGTNGNLPRCMVPGVFLTKYVHMSNRLDRMVRDYSIEKNMAQRDVFDIALIDFFKKYGHGKEVDTRLADRN